MDIKFRFWDEKNKKMINNPIINDIDSAVNYIGINSLFRKFKKNNFIAMQWTGFSDEKRENIYEGDIVKTVHNDFSWVLTRNRWGYINLELLSCRNVIDTLDGHVNSHFIIIGNIYENSELYSELLN